MTAATPRLQASGTALSVAMTVDAVGGVWRYAMELARGLRAQGIQVVFVGLGPAPDADQTEEAAPIGEVIWLDHPLDWLVREPEVLDHLARDLSRLAKELGVDLLHLNAPSQACGLDVEMPVVAVSHSCVPTWWRVVRGNGLPDDWQWQARRNREGLLAADAVVAPSGSHAEQMRSAYGALPHLEVVHNSLAAFLAADNKESFVFAAARWWDEGKNAAILDAAAADLAWPVFMAGPTRGPDGQHVAISHARHAVLAHREVLNAARRAAIFVSPSIYEPFGLAALEAARAGAALVLSDIATYRELWADAAIFFDPRDRDGLLRVLRALSSDPQGLSEWGARALGRSRRFTPDVQAASMAAIYRRLRMRPAMTAADGRR